MLFESKTRPAGPSVHSFLTNLCLILICIYFNQSNNGAQATNSPQSQQQQQPTMILKPHQNHRSAQSRDLFQFRHLDDAHLPDQQIYQNYTQHREDTNAGKSIYSSLLKIIYQLRRQIEHERLLSRADDNEDQERIRQVSTKSRPLVFVGTDAANQTSNRDHEQTLTYNVTNEEQQSKPFQVIDQIDSVRNQRNMHEPHDDQFKPTLAPAKLLLQQIPASLSSTLAPNFRYSSKFSPLDTTRRWQANSLLEGADDSYDYDENPALFEPAKPSLGSNSLSASIENQYPSTSPKMSRFHSLDFSPNHKLNGKSHKKAEYSSSPSYHRRYGRKSLQLPGMTISPLRPSDYSELSSEANEQHLDGEDSERSNLNGMNPSSTLSTSDHQQNNDRWPKLNPQNIQLQQVYPTTSQTKTQATHSKSSGPARPSIFKTFSSDGQMGAQMSSSSIIGGGGGSGSGSGGPTLAAFENLASQNQIHLQPQPSQSQPQGDLVNQPQTIQITAIPNSGLGFNNNPIIRIAGNGVAPFGALNGAGLWNNGAGYLDPYGRQVLMVNSERRQNDWSVWFWPILAIVALPLVLGALFVPVFLKTIVVLIQILQSLGLLLPIANALGQQMMLQQASSMPVNTIDNTQKNLSSINY